MENISIPAHLVRSVIEILSDFNYESDEDSVCGMSFFEGRINEDNFFAVKWALEKSLQ